MAQAPPVGGAAVPASQGRIPVWFQILAVQGARLLCMRAQAFIRAHGLSVVPVIPSRVRLS